jgi:hypothetical protein
MATSNFHSMNILVLTYFMSRLFMTINVQREARKAMMALHVASNKVYGVKLPQGLQHEFAQVTTTYCAFLRRAKQKI